MLFGNLVDDETVHLFLQQTALQRESFYRVFCHPVSFQIDFG